MSRPLIQCIHLYKFFGDEELFKGISLSIHNGQKYALIGENGSGKTTLLEIIGGLQLADEGVVQRAKGLTIGVLAQELAIPDQEISVRGYILDGPLTEIEKKMRLLEDHLEDPSSLITWADLHEEYERKGGYDRPPLEEVLYQLQLTINLDSPMSSLSTGQKVRASLAKTLQNHPDVLLLDEPTNHLDQKMINWLNRLLARYKGAAIIISHDRKFLNASCNRLLELHQGFLSSYQGNYTYYLEEQKRLIEKKIQAYEAQSKERNEIQEKIRSLSFSKDRPKLASDNDKLSYNQRGGGYQKSAQRTLDQLKTRLKEIEEDRLIHPNPKTITGLNFPRNSLSSKIAIELLDLSKSFNGNEILSHITRTVYNGDRILITGPNGSGKTTFLSLVERTLLPDCGSIQITPGAKVAYLDQDLSILPSGITPLEYFFHEFKLTKDALCQKLHQAGLGNYDLISRPFKNLSVGQRKRLALLSLILQEPNILLLDEPTNHLDLLTLEALEKALLSFDGTIIAVSHDQMFIDKIGGDLWCF